MGKTSRDVEKFWQMIFGRLGLLYVQVNRVNPLTQLAKLATS